MIRKLKIASIFVLGLLVAACGEGENSSALSGAQDNGKGEFLPVEKAFVLSIKAQDEKSITAHWDIADGYHLYKDKFEFALGDDNYQISSLKMPEGKMIEDKVFGNKLSYEGQLDVTISLKKVNDTGKVILKTSYQGCSEKGLCYPPQHIETELAL